jgi:Fic family protein
VKNGAACGRRALAAARGQRLRVFEGFLSTSKYARLAKCSADTALRDIRELLERGILIQNPGGGRSTSWRLGEPENVTV